MDIQIQTSNFFRFNYQEKLLNNNTNDEEKEDKII